MPKDENDRTPAEDYLARLNWEANKSRRRPSLLSDTDEPNWKYKIIPSNENMTTEPSWPGLGRLVLVIAIGIVGFALYRGFAENPGEVLFFGIVFIIILTVIILAIRDLSVKREDPDEFDE